MENKEFDINDQDFNPALVEEEDISSYDTFEGKVDNSFKMYLKDIGSVPLLTPSQELKLAKFVFDGNEAKAKKDLIDSNDDENMSIEEYQELEEAIRSGKWALDKLVESNLRLVVSIAKHYKNDHMQLMDLIQEGTMGLTKAATKYDYRTGYRFSTYATWWIRQSIVRAIADQSRTIRIPVHVVEDLRKINNYKNDYTQRNGHEPSLIEIAEATNLTEDKVKQYISYQNTVVSMDTVVGEDEESTLAEFIGDDANKNPFEYTMELKIKEEIEEILVQVLTDKERMVIEMRYGINGYPESTLEEVAARPEYNVTRERIRQIEAKAMRKLRCSERFKTLALAYLAQKRH